MAGHKRVLLVYLVIGLLVAACGPRTGAPAPAPAPRPEGGGSALAPGPSIEELYAAARAEGKVLVYSSLNLDDVAQLFPLFESRFPGVKIEHTRATGERLLQRLVTEVRGGSVFADVFETNGFEIYNAVKEGLTEPFCPANIADLNPDLYDKDCQWIGTRTNHDIVAWNTNLVRPGEEPRTYEDLGDPRWRDKILVEATDVEMFNALLSDRGYGEQRGTEMFRRIAANNPEVHSGHTEIADLLAAGHRAVFLGAYAHRIEQLKGAGAPVEWMKTEGVLYLNGVTKIKGGPNPNAGKLFITWLMSLEGQEALAEKAGRYTLNPKATKVAYPVPSTFKIIPSRPEYAETIATRQRQWNQLFGLR